MQFRSRIFALSALLLVACSSCAGTDGARDVSEARGAHKQATLLAFLQGQGGKLAKLTLSDLASWVLRAYSGPRVFGRFGTAGGADTARWRDDFLAAHPQPGFRLE